MFRGIKKRVKSFGDSRHRGATQENEINKLDTPRRVVSVSSSSSALKQQASTRKKTSKSNNNIVRKKSIHIDLESEMQQEPIKHLEAFDKCIETSDNMQCRPQHDTVLESRNNAGPIPDCSLLVSPDGDLLLVPTGEKPTELFKKKKESPLPVMGTVESSDEDDCSKLLLGDLKTPTKEDKTVDDEAVIVNKEEQPLKEDQGEAKSEGQSPDNPDEKNADTDISDSDNNSVDDDIELNQTITSGDTSQRSGNGSFSELMLHGKDDYESACFLGNDLHPTGDKALNRFSAKGWSIPATSLALQQTGNSLNALAHFCEQMVLSRKESAARTTIACDNLRSEAAKNHYQTMAANQWEIIDPRAKDFDLTSSRTGPFQAETSTLHAATAAVEHYHNTAAEKESRRWRMASLQRNGVLSAMHTATDQFHERSTNRQQALEETSRRANAMEDRLRSLKQQAGMRWEAVYKAEDRVTKRLEELLTARSKERRNARLKQLREDELQRRAAGDQTPEPGDERHPSNMSEEVWDIVSSLADGSFEPVSIPATSDAASAISDEVSTASSNKELPATHESTASSSMPAREQVEQDLGLPELRKAAMKADEEIQDAADALLNILSSLDTTRRSARIAAETCMVAAANAQANCLRSMVELERASLQERLNDLDGLEEVLDKIDVRADLDEYICADKQERGGSSHLRDDDDGGIASALAILSSHLDGSSGDKSSSALNGTGHSSMMEQSEEDKKASPDMLNESIEKLFEENSAFHTDASESDDATIKARSDYESNVDFLCKSAAENSNSARSRRSTMCYALNAKRSQDARIVTPIQFEGLCKVFSAILTGCHLEDGGVANAKMCMMLAQTFYFEKEAGSEQVKASMDDSNASSPYRQARKRRVYVKSSLVNHEIWSKDEFWDSALSLQISESLTHSGVLSNFERNRQTTKRAEWAETHKTKWYDLTYTERIEAASQVHALVFAQLSALAHSMIEVGCGLERSCAFVRRMSIRNQLPSSQRTMLLMHLMNRNKKAT